ncbi:MAG: YegS/Rv2252/BmrU family lipid kinase, partial [Clostridia bacterium]|nr:YegS/Rv2252/BmrU family lipid kinase [Clostridia bacterium]
MLTLIVNPTAGTGYALKVEQRLRSLLESKRIAHRILHTDRPGHATALAREAAQSNDSDAVVAVGGDGTAFEVACGLADTDTALGIIPAGTGNDFIKSVGIPRDPEQALDFILKHKARPVDFGSMNDRAFINVCGTGFDVTVLENMQEAKKKFRGMLPYLIGVVKAIVLYKPVHVRLTIDGNAVNLSPSTPLVKREFL